ncbi:MAG TPA: hypothetical protein VM487_25015 [Phycisphaerae bacterium]|nr:hypothetical protein [Phycisphaerae bacterium]
MAEFRVVVKTLRVWTNVAAHLVAGETAGLYDRRQPPAEDSLDR